MAKLHFSITDRLLFIGRLIIVGWALAWLITASASAQITPSPTAVFLPNQVVRIGNLPSLTAPSSKSTAVLATALETIIRDRDVCCGKDSGLEDAVLSASSLKDLGAKIEGRHVLGDGLSINVRAEYVPTSSLSARLLVSTLMNQKPMLLGWKSRVYVVYGAVYDETRIYDPDGWQFVIHKLLLLDVRFSDHRREVEFDSESDDWNTIQGVLTASFVRQ
ncbi:MAG TPA: hypothetical protein VK828_02380 [Terriglobales bacterium]|jgi:hypothetical protein|nr:hypothetical protein [Terriglobales bacterium]